MALSFEAFNCVNLPFNIKALVTFFMEEGFEIDKLKVIDGSLGLELVKPAEQGAVPEYISINSKNIADPNCSGWVVCRENDRPLHQATVTGYMYLLQLTPV